MGLQLPKDLFEFLESTRERQMAKTKIREFPEPRLDRTASGRMIRGEKHNDRKYWLSRSPDERIAHAEFLRRIAFGAEATKRLQRVSGVSKRK